MTNQNNQNRHGKVCQCGRPKRRKRPTFIIYKNGEVAPVDDSDDFNVWYCDNCSNCN